MTAVMAPKRGGSFMRDHPRHSFYSIVKAGDCFAPHLYRNEKGKTRGVFFESFLKWIRFLWGWIRKEEKAVAQFLIWLSVL